MNHTESIKRTLKDISIPKQTKFLNYLYCRSQNDVPDKQDTGVHLAANDLKEKKKP